MALTEISEIAGTGMESAKNCIGLGEKLHRTHVHGYENLIDAFKGNVKLILGQGQLRSMLHFHDPLIAAIASGDADRAERAVADNFVETDVRLGLLLQQ